MKRAMVLVVVLFACGKSEKSEPAKETTSSGPAKPAETAKPTVDVGEKKKKFCKRVDRDALAKLFEIESLTTTGGGTLIKGGGEPPSLACSYYEGSKTDGGVSFGFSFKGTDKLEKPETLGKFTWESYDGFGQPALIGRAKDGEIHLATVAKKVLVHSDLEHPKLQPADVEKRLVEATKAVIAQLPDDANVELQ